MTPTANCDSPGRGSWPALPVTSPPARAPSDSEWVTSTGPGYVVSGPAPLAASWPATTRLADSEASVTPPGRARGQAGGPGSGPGPAAAEAAAAASLRVRWNGTGRLQAATGRAYY